MSRASHTPGPWTAAAHFSGEPEEFEEWRIEYPSGNGCWLATVHIGACADAAELAEEEANARLIAAAPDLLAATVEADGCYEAALCEGWLEALAEGDIERIRDLWSRRLSHARNLFPAALAKATGTP